jgi:hypothetical protein
MQIAFTTTLVNQCNYNTDHTRKQTENLTLYKWHYFRQKLTRCSVLNVAQAT